MKKPPMRRGLSPEGQEIRARHRGSLSIGTVVHTGANLGNVTNSCNFQSDKAANPYFGETYTVLSGSQVDLAEKPVPSAVSNSGQVSGIYDKVLPVSKSRDGSAHSDYFSLSEEPQNIISSGENDTEHESHFSIPNNTNPSREIDQFVNAKYPLQSQIQPENMDTLNTSNAKCNSYDCQDFLRTKSDLDNVMQQSNECLTGENGNLSVLTEESTQLRSCQNTLSNINVLVPAEQLIVEGFNLDRTKIRQRQKNQELSSDNPLKFDSHSDDYSCAEDRGKTYLLKSKVDAVLLPDQLGCLETLPRETKRVSYSQDQLPSLSSHSSRCSNRGSVGASSLLLQKQLEHGTVLPNNENVSHLNNGKVRPTEENSISSRFHESRVDDPLKQRLHSDSFNTDLVAKVNECDANPVIENCELSKTYTKVVPSVASKEFLFNGRKPMVTLSDEYLFKQESPRESCEFKKSDNEAPPEIDKDSNPFKISSVENDHFEASRIPFTQTIHNTLHGLETAVRNRLSLDSECPKDSLISRLQSGSSMTLMPAPLVPPTEFSKSLRRNSFNRKLPKGEQILPARVYGSSPNLESLSPVLVSENIRRQKVADILSKIKEKKPTCDLDYWAFKKSIERQHASLFVPKRTIVSSGAIKVGHSVGNISKRSDVSGCSTSQISGMKPRSSVRARSVECQSRHSRVSSVGCGSTEKLPACSGKSLASKNDLRDSKGVSGNTSAKSATNVNKIHNSGKSDTDSTFVPSLNLAACNQSTIEETVLDRLVDGCILTSKSSECNGEEKSMSLSNNATREDVKNTNTLEQNLKTISKSNASGSEVDHRKRSFNSETNSVSAAVTRSLHESKNIKMLTNMPIVSRDKSVQNDSASSNEANIHLVPKSPLDGIVDLSSESGASHISSRRSSSVNSVLCRNESTNQISVPRHDVNSFTYTKPMTNILGSSASVPDLAGERCKNNVSVSNNQPNRDSARDGTALRSPEIESELCAVSTPRASISHTTVASNTIAQKQDDKASTQSSQAAGHQSRTRAVCDRSTRYQRNHSPPVWGAGQPASRQRSKSGEPPPSYKRGKVPRYLQARRADEARRAAEEASRDPACPADHTPLPEQQRLHTLRLLRISIDDVQNQLAKLPVANDSLRLRQHRQQLEDKLVQLEDGIRIFSQPVVYVLLDD